MAPLKLMIEIGTFIIFFILFIILFNFYYKIFLIFDSTYNM